MIRRGSSVHSDWTVTFSGALSTPWQPFRIIEFPMHVQCFQKLGVGGEGVVAGAVAASIVFSGNTAGTVLPRD